MDKIEIALNNIKFQIEMAECTCVKEILVHIQDLYVLTDFVADVLCEKQERDNQKPLTMEQIKERVGKPVYLIRTAPCLEKEWRVIADIEGNRVNFKTSGYWVVDTYGTDWHAYDHEPRVD